MEVKIYYCTMWNYMPHAARVAEEIKHAYNNANITLVPASGGHFVVEANGKIIFSKRDLIGCESERFPKEGEILALLKEG